MLQTDNIMTNTNDTAWNVIPIITNFKIVTAMLAAIVIF